MFGIHRHFRVHAVYAIRMIQLSQPDVTEGWHVSEML